MPIELYYIAASPPVRAVRLTAKALNIDLELKKVDMMTGEHLQPWYLEMNPLHTVPTLNDNGFIVFDSHAICGYLVNQYGKDDSLYPKEPKKRAIVDQRLHFDSGTLFARLRTVMLPIIRKQATSIPEDQKVTFSEAYDFLDKLLGSNKWVAGDTMTIADFCCVATTSSMDFVVPGLDKHPNVLAWIERCRNTMVGYEEANQVGLEQHKIFFASLTNKDS